MGGCYYCGCTNSLDAYGRCVNCGGIARSGAPAQITTGCPQAFPVFQAARGIPELGPGLSSSSCRIHTILSEVQYPYPALPTDEVLAAIFSELRRVSPGAEFYPRPKSWSVQKGVFGETELVCELINTSGTIWSARLSLLCPLGTHEYEARLISLTMRIVE